MRTPEGAERGIGDVALLEELAGGMGHPLFLLKSARGIFDCQHISLFSLASVRALAMEAGCPIDPRQFRANRIRAYFGPSLKDTRARPASMSMWSGPA